LSTPTATTLTTTPTPTTPPANAESFVDLQPYLIDGKSPFLVENSANYTQTKLTVGITNAGTKDAMPTNSENSSVIAELYNASQKCYEWDVQKISAGENITLETTVGELLEKNAYIKPGVNYLNIKIHLRNGTEPNTANNNSAEYNIVLAHAPIPQITKPETDLEKIIYNLFSGETKVFTPGKETEALNIVKPFLKDFGINYDAISLTFGDYDYLSSEYKKVFGWDNPYGLHSIAFTGGDAFGKRYILVQNGTPAQSLLSLMREEIAANASNKTPGLMGALYNALDEKGNLLWGNDLIAHLGSWYAIKALDEAGFGGYTNVSYNTKNSAISYLSYALREKLYTKNTLAIYVIADEMVRELGYADRSQITSKDIQDKIHQLMEGPSDKTVSYFQSVVSKVYNMSTADYNKIIEDITWNGFCNKELDDAYPEKVKSLIDPKNKFGDIHPDDVSAVQIWFLLPR
jgi:hypothetical protein